MGLLDEPREMYSSIILWITIIIIHISYYIFQKPLKRDYMKSIKYDISQFLTFFGIITIIILIPGYFISIQYGVSIPNYILTFFYSKSFEYFDDQIEMFEKHSNLLNFHILFNFSGFLVGSLQILFIKKLDHFQHKVLGSLYIIFMFIGCFSVLRFCKDYCYGVKIDNGFSVFTSFLFMGLSVVIPSFIGFYKIYVQKLKVSHAEWMLKSYISAWGSFILFRLLILFYLPFAKNFYSAWMIIIFTSWLIPYYLMDIYLSYKRDLKIN